MIIPSRAQWFCGAGKPAAFSQILEEIINSDPSVELYVGTDSDPSRKKVAFVTSVVIRYPGNGANYYWSRKYMDSSIFFNLGHRLELEVTDSIIVADLLRRETGREKIVIHADCSSDPKNASFEFLNRITSYSKAMGFATVVKPDSWAASSVADKHAKSVS